MQYKNIKALKVYYDLGLRTKVEKGTKGAVCFDSESEFSLFRFLSEFSSNYTIDIHKNVYYSDLAWKVDFTLKFRDRYKLLQVCKKFKLVPKANKIYIEYKGILDKNFRIKIENFNFNQVCQSTIFISKELLGFSIYDSMSEKVVTYPIYSFNLFKKFWRNLNA